MTGPSDGFEAGKPDGFSAANVEKIMQHFDGLPDDGVRVGLSCIFSYFKYRPETVQQSLRNYLQAAEETDTPITVKLDGEQWWDARPDLWNWWDPDLPGYDPDNVSNVEWTGWGPEYALKSAWRDWGRQIRVRPPPNLMSPAYRKACHEALEPLLAIIMDWQRSLPKEKRDLLVGVEVGWESAIGVNHFYPKEGDDYLDLQAKDDPRFKKDRSQLLNRGGKTQGYAAAYTGGIRKSGTLEYEDQVKIVQRHLEDLSRVLRKAGLPRSRIFTHGWGNEDGEALYDAAVNRYSCPGWSCYWYSHRMQDDSGINRGIRESDAEYWAAVEWLFRFEFKKEPWIRAFKSTLFHRNCRYLTFYNWSAIMEKENGDQIIEAVHEVIKEHNRE
ncbi:hypothetical protein PDESU_01819 [Pontiella desulfatans]|uniref:Glycoside hydrolase family 42 N-terminal domain-containing protein n=2 Tax=Pontiella desulfatans TaxID=2750659 RepID=A0A6C2U072_PONDE|nr:hypothetical protein PDESU_01819 [Pontiella desulfatans]